MLAGRRPFERYGSVTQASRKRFDIVVRLIFAVKNRSTATKSGTTPRCPRTSKHTESASNNVLSDENSHTITFAYIAIPRVSKNRRDEPAGCNILGRLLD